MKNYVLLLCLFISPRAFATADGYLVKVDSRTVYLDWGKASGIERGSQFSAYRPGTVLKHPVTGEILGNSETDLGSGVVEQVADKFSIGRILEQTSDWKVGDRIRLDVAPVSAPVASGAVPVAAVHGPTLKEIWRSDALDDDPRGITLGDLDGDKIDEVIVAYTHRLEVLSWKEGKLQRLSSYVNKRYPGWVAVDVSDPDHSGKNKIFATYYQEGLHRSRVIVLELSGTILQPAGDFNGFARVFPRLDGSRPLWAQDLSMSRDLRIYPPTLVTKTDGKYKAKQEVKLSRPLNDDQLFGYGFGDWDGDGVEDWAYLHKGERLQLFFKNTKWSSSDLFGGTKNGFTYDNGKDDLASVYSRLVTWTPKNGKPQLLVSRNKPELGIRLMYLKIYKESEILGLGWNGSEMAPVWRLPISGYLADFQIGDAIGSGSPQLWTAIGAPGDKTVLVGYALPQ